MPLLNLVNKICGVLNAFSTVDILSVLPSSDAKIRVLVADTLAMSCNLLVDALRRHKDYHAAAVTNRKKAIQAAQRERFDVILIGIDSSDDLAESTSVIRQLQAVDSKLNIVALLEAPERTIVVEALRSGARGVFCRSGSFEALCKCIHAVHGGQVWANATELEYITDTLFESGGKSSRMASLRPLSKREEQITRLVAEGYSNRQISERLNLSEHTIKNYLFRVFEKLGVTTRVGLTLYALKHGQMSPSKLQSSLPILIPSKNSSLPS